jgi:heptosyltransferase I
MMSAVGDAVHVLPVVTALKRHAPQSRISWVLQPAPASLVRGHPAVDEIIAFDPALGARAFLDVRRALAQRRFDLVLDLQVALKAGLVTAMTRAPVKLGFDRARARDFNWVFTTHRIPAGPRRHVQDQYFEFLAALGVSPEPVRWDLGPWPDERSWQRQFFASAERPTAAVVVATSKPERDWPPERWSEVVDALWHDFGLEPILVGGRSARELHAEAVITSRARRRPRRPSDRPPR